MKPLKVVVRQIKSLTEYLIVIFTGLERTDYFEQHLSTAVHLQTPKKYLSVF